MWLDNYTLINTGMAKSRKKLKELEQRIVYMNMFLHYLDLTIRTIGVEGLPETCNARVIKEALLFYDSFAFINKKGVLISLPAAPSEDFNMYKDAKYIRSWTFNGKTEKHKVYLSKDLTPEMDILYEGFVDKIKDAFNNKPDSTLIWGHENRYPFVNYIIYYAQAVADTMIALENAVVWTKQPFIPVAEESLVASVEKIFDKIKGNEAIIPVSTGVLELNKFNILPFDSSGQGAKTDVEIIDWYDQQYMKLLGFDANTQVDKKGENITEDEIHMNADVKPFEGALDFDYVNDQLERLTNPIFNVKIKVVNKIKRNDKEVENNDDTVHSATNEDI